MYYHIIIIYHHTSSFTIILFWTCSIQHIISQWFSPMFFNFYMNFQWQARMKNRPRMPGRRSCYAPPARRGLRDAGRPRHRRTTPRCGGVEDVAPWVFTMAGWCFGTFFPQFSPYIGNNHPNWLIFFQRGWNDQPDGKRMNMMKCSGFTCPTRDFDFGQVENLGKVGEVLKLEKKWVNCIELWIFRNNIRDEPAGAPTGRCWL